MSKPGTKQSRFVPVPNRIFDELIPALTDTELRVLLIVIRSTLGWRILLDTGEVQHKYRDWITNSQFSKKTARSSTAVSAAIKSLAARGIIVVENTHGEKLQTASERRHVHGRLYYRLSDTWMPCKLSDNRKVATTTYKYYKIHNKEADLRTGWHRAADISRRAE